MKTTKIRGNDYITVNERLKHFRSDERFKDCAIIDEIVDRGNPESEIYVRATIIKYLDGNQIILSQAHSQEYITKTGVNKTSFLENATTSAIGRALGYLGIGIDTAIASKDEVDNAVHLQQNMKNRLTTDQLKKTLMGTKDQAVKVLDMFSMTADQKNQIINHFKIK